MFNFYLQHKVVEILVFFEFLQLIIYVLKVKLFILKHLNFVNTSQHTITFQKTNNNFFIFVNTKNYLIFTTSLYSFVGRHNRGSEVTRFWYIFTKFLHLKLKLWSIWKFNVISKGGWYYRISLLLVKGKFLKNVKKLYFTKQYAHNGCKLKKRRRRKSKRLRIRFKKNVI